MVYNFARLLIWIKTFPKPEKCLCLAEYFRKLSGEMNQHFSKLGQGKYVFYANIKQKSYSYFINKFLPVLFLTVISGKDLKFGR